MRACAAVSAVAAALILTVGACDVLKRDGGKTEKAGKQAQPIDPGTACDTLDRAECLRAHHCTLHFQKNTRYDCRPAKGPCEEDLIQGNRRACEARDGCEWQQARCYCPFPGYGQTKVPDKGPPGGACVCGGGPPARCVAEGTPPVDMSAPTPSGSASASAAPSASASAAPSAKPPAPAD